MLDDRGMPSSGSAAAAALVSHERGFVTILRTLPRRAIGEAATRKGEKAEREAVFEGGASVFAAGVDSCCAMGESAASV